MDIDRLFSDKEYLEKEINFFINKKHIKKIQENKESSTKKEKIKK